VVFVAVGGAAFVGGTWVGTSVGGTSVGADVGGAVVGGAWVGAVVGGAWVGTSAADSVVGGNVGCWAFAVGGTAVAVGWVCATWDCSVTPDVGAVSTRVWWLSPLPPLWPTIRVRTTTLRMATMMTAAIVDKAGPRFGVVIVWSRAHGEGGFWIRSSTARRTVGLAGR
jgi:hypothetical protein